MSVRRSWTTLLVALLLLVPLAVGAHVHAAHAERACAVCVVTHHAPALRVEAPPAPVPTIVASAWVPANAAAPIVAERPVHAGRGPPVSLYRSVR